MAERPHRLKIAAVWLAVVLGAGAAAAAAAALAATVFTDPVGDVRGGAGPDVVSISVSHTAASVTFRFRFASAPPLGTGARKAWVDMLILGIDVPPRSLKRSPQGWSGLDYYAGLHGIDRAAIFVKASPAGPSQPSTVLSRPKIVVSGRTLGFSLGRRALGDPAWIELVVATGRETSQQAAGGGSDEAPNRGTYHYRLRG